MCLALQRSPRIQVSCGLDVGILISPSAPSFSMTYNITMSLSEGFRSEVNDIARLRMREVSLPPFAPGCLLTRPLSVHN